MGRRWCCIFLLSAAVACPNIALADDIQNSPTNSGPIGVRISFQGDIVGNNLAEVLTKAYDQSSGSLDLVKYPISQNDTVCGILQKLNYPPPCQAYFQLVDRINNAPITQQPLQANTIITLPGVELTPERSIRVFTKSIPAENSQGNELLRNWKDFNARIIERSDSFAVQFTTYDLLLRVADDGAANQLFDQLVGLRSKNVLVNLLTSAVNPAPKLHSYQHLPESNEIKTECLTGALKDKAAASGLPIFRYNQLMEGDADAVEIVKKTSPAPSTNVSVVIIDTVLNTPKPQDSPLASWQCKWGDFVKSEHHANLLAGIIESDGPFHIFEGLSDHVSISGYSWWKPGDVDATVLAKGSTDRSTELGQKFNDGYTDEPLTVYLVATEFDGYAAAIVTDGQLNDKYKRFVGRQPEGAIVSARPLLIVAAGQAEQNGDPVVPISPTSPHSPQNLGDLENVIVVTACQDCGFQQPRLYKQAYYSVHGAHMVHVAAAGVDPVAGWIDDNHISAAGGTSQSAAFVAGLAASMISRFPTVYTTPVSIKTRIQVTSRPFPPQPDHTANPDADELAAGIVDPVLAQLDPTKHWFKQNGVWSAIKIRKWSTGYFNIAISNSLQRTDGIKSGSVLRIVKTQNESVDAPSLSTIYVDALKDGANQQPGTIDRYDLVTRSDGTSLVLCDGTSIPFAKIDDLIIGSAGISANECR